MALVIREAMASSAGICVLGSPRRALDNLLFAELTCPYFPVFLLSMAVFQQVGQTLRGSVFTCVV